MRSDSVVLEKTNKFMSINEAAELLRVHQQTLRNWERRGLIKPIRAGMRRIYTEENIILCRKIKEFSGRGISLKGIKELITKI